MSFAAEEWKVDLSPRALQKVEQLEAQLNRFRKEAEMKQFKMDGMEQVIQKEKRRLEEERSQVASLKRETQSLSEACEEVEQKRQKLATDLHMKETSVTALNSQIAHLRKQLEQENSKVSNLQMAVEKFESNQLGQDDKYEKLLADHEKLKQMNQHQIKDCSALRTECNLLKQRCSDEENKKLALQTENEEMKAQLKDQSSIKSSEFKLVCDQLKVEKENMKLYEKKTSEEMKQLQCILENKEIDLQKVLSEAKCKEDKLVTALKTISIEVQNLKETNSRKLEKEAQMRAKVNLEVDEVKNNLAEKSEENSKLMKDVRFLRDSLTNMQTSNESLKDDLKSKELAIVQGIDLNEKLQKDMENRIKELQVVNGKLEEGLKVCMKELENMKDQMKNVQADLYIKENSLQEYLSDLRNVQAQKDSCDRKIIDMERNYDSVCVSINEVRREKDDLVTQNAALQQDLIEKGTVLLGKEKEVNDLRLEISHSNESLDDLRKKFDDILSQLQSCESNYQQFKSDAEAQQIKFCDDRKQLEEKLQDSKNENNIMSQKIETVLNEVKDMKDRNEMAEKEVRDRCIEIDQLQKSLDDSQKMFENKEKEINRLDTQNQNINAKLTDLQNEYINLQRRNEDLDQLHEMGEKIQKELEEKISQCAQELQKVNSVLHEIREEKDELFSENQRKYGEIEDLQSSLKLQESESVQYQISINKLNETVQQLKDTIHEKEAFFFDKETKLLQDIEELTSANEKNEKHIDENNRQILLKSEKIESLETSIESWLLEKVDLEKKCELLEKEKEELNFILLDANSKQEHQTVSIQDLKDEILALKDKQHNLEHDCTVMKAELTGNINELSAIVDDKELKMNVLEEEIISKKHTLCDLQNKLEIVSKERTDFELNIKRLAEERDQARHCIEEQQKCTEKLNQSVSSLNATVASLKDEIASKDVEFSQSIAQFQQNIEDYQQQIDVGQSRICSLEKEVEEKHFVLQTMNEKVDKLQCDKTDAEQSKNMAENEIGKLLHEIESLRNLKETDILKIGHLQCEIVSLKDEMKKQLDCFIEKEGMHNQEIEALQSRVTAKGIENEQLKLEAHQHFEALEEKFACIERISTDKENVEANCFSLKQKLDEMTLVISSVEEDNKQKKTMIEQLQMEAASLKDKINTNAIEISESKATYLQQINELETICENKDKEVKQLTVEIQCKEEAVRTHAEHLEIVKMERRDSEMKILCLEEEKETLQCAEKKLASSVESLQQRVKHLEHETVELKDKVMDISMEESINRANLTREISDLKTALEDKTTTVAQLEANIAIKAEIIQSKQVELKSISDARENANMNINKLEEKLKELKFVVSEADNAVSKKQIVIEELKNEIKTLKDTANVQATEESINRAKLSQDLRELQNTIEGKKLEIIDLTSALQHKQEEIDSKCAILSNTVAAKTELQANVTMLDMQVAELQDRCDAAKAVEEKQNDLIGDLQNDIVRLKDEMHEKIQEESRQQAQLQKEILDLNQRILEKTSEIESLKLTIDDMEQTVKLLENGNAIITTENSELKALINEQEKQIIESQRLQDESHQKANLYMNSSDRLQTEILCLKDHIQKLEMESTEARLKLENGMKEWEVSYVAKDTEIASLKTDLELADMKYKKVFSQLDSVYQEKEDAQKSCSYLNTEIENIKYQLNEAVKESALKSENLTILQTEIQNLKDELSDLSVEESVLKANLKKELDEQKIISAEFSKQVDYLTNEILCKDEILHQLKDQIVCLEDDRTAMEDKLHACNSKCEEYHSVIEKLEQSEKEQSSVISTLTTDNKKLADDLHELNISNSIKVADLSQENDSFRKLIETKENDVVKLKQELEHASKNNEKQLIAIDLLQCENRSYEENLSAKTSEVEKLKTTLQEYTLLRNEDKLNLEEKEQNCDSLQRQISSLLLQKESEEAQMHSVKDEFVKIISEKEAKIMHLQSDLQMSQDSLFRVQNELQDIRQHSTDMEFEMESLKKIESELSQDLEVKNACLKEKLCRLEKVEKEFESLQKSFHKCSSDAEKLSISLQKEEGKVNVFKCKIESLEQKGIDQAKNIEDLLVHKGDAENNLEKTTDELNQLKDSLLLMKQEKETLQHNNNKLQVEISTLNDFLLEKDEICSKLQTQAGEFQASINKKETNVLEMQDEIESLGLKVKDLSSSNEQLLGLTEELSTKMGKYEQDLAEQSYLLSEANGEVSNLKKLLQEKQSEFDSYMDSMIEKEKCTRESQSQIDLEMKHLKESLLSKTEQLNKLQEDMMSASNRLVEMQEENELQQRTLQGYETDLNRKEQENSDLRTDIASTLELDKKDKDALNENLEMVRADFEALQRENIDLQNKMSIIDFTLKEKVVNLESLHMEKETLLENIKQCEESNTELKATVDCLNSKISNLNSEKIHAEKKLNDQEHQLQSTQAFSQCLQDQLLKHDTNSKSLEDKIIELTEAKDSFESSLQQATIEIEGLKSEMNNAVIEHEQKLNNMIEENTLNGETILKLQNAISNRDSDLADLQIEQKKLEEEIMQLNEEKKILTEEGDAAQNLCSDVESKLTNMNLKFSQLEGALQEALENIAVLETTKSDIMLENRTLAEENERCKTNLADIQKELHCTKTDLDIVNREKQAMSDKYIKAEIECQSNASIIQDLEESLETQKQQIQNYEEKNSIIQGEIEGLLKQLAEKEQEMANLQQENSQKSNDAEIYSADFSEAREKINQLILDKEHASDKLLEVNNELKSVMERCKECQSQNDNLTQTVSELKGKLSHTTKELQKQEDTCAGLQKQNDGYEKKLNKLETEKSELEELIEFTTVENTMKDDETAVLTQKVQDLESKIASLEADLKTAKIEYTNVEEKFLCLEKTHSVIQIERNRFEEKIQEIEDQTRNVVEKLQFDLKEALNEVEDFKSMMESLEYENASLESIKNDCEAKQLAIEAEKKSLHSELSDLKQALHASHQRQIKESQKVEECQKNIQNQHDLLDSLNVDLVEQKQAITKLTEERDCLKGEHKALKDKLDSLKLNLSSFENNTLDISLIQTELQSLKEDNIELQQRLATQAREKNELLAQFLSLEDKKYGLEKQNTIIQAKVDDLSKELANKEQHVSIILEQLDTAENVSKELREQLDKRSSEISELKELNLTLAGDMANLKTELDSLQQAHTAAQGECDTLLADIACITSQRTVTTEECEQLQAEVRRLTAVTREQETLQQQYEEQNSRLHALEVEKKKVIEEEELLRTKAVELEKQLEETRRELSSVRQQLEEQSVDKSKEELQQNLEKWSGRCSKLNAQLLMEKKNSNKYLEQIKCLKTNVDQQLTEKTSELRANLESARKEADMYLDKYHTLTQRYTALEEHFVQLKQKVASKGTEAAVIRSEDENSQHTKQDTNCIISTAAAGNQQDSLKQDGEPVAKRLRNSTSGILETGHEEDGSTRRSSPLSLSKSKRRAETSPDTGPLKKPSPKQTAARLPESSNQSNGCLSNNMDSKFRDAEKPLQGRRGAKGLRPTTSRVNTDARVIVNKLTDKALTGSTKFSAGQTEAEKAKEIASKPLLSKATLTRSQASRSRSKLDTAQQSSSKNPLGTITNSPVKKPGSSVSTTVKVSGPQRTLSLKKSPQVAKTRRQARAEEEHANLEQDEPAECKVS